jgi:hypothetical protein
MWVRVMTSHAPDATNTRVFESSQAGPKAKITPSSAISGENSDSGADVPLLRIGNQVPSDALVF